MLIPSGAKVNERKGSDQENTRETHGQQASPRRQPACQAAGGELSAGLGAQAPGRMDSVISWNAAGKQIVESRTFLGANSAYRKELNASPLRAGGDEINGCETSDAGVRAPERETRISIVDLSSSGAGGSPRASDGAPPAQPELDACRLKASGDGSSAQETQKRNRSSSPAHCELLSLLRATRLALREEATAGAEDLGRENPS
ncbi:hypothetical protein LTR35_014715 [Friedmanniomyces endolithicus]|nr:hypothetical protein LTR35_014715 [Friedmanniomyces endolithicus]